VYEGDPGRGIIAGTVFDIPINLYLEFFAQAFPGKTFGFVYNPKLYHQDEIHKDRLLTAASKMNPPLKIIPVEVDAPQISEEQQARADIFFGRYYVSKNLQEFISSSKKPFVAADISHAYKGAIATISTDSTELGRMAAEQLLYPNLMSGTALSDLPIIIPQKGIIGINLSAARRYNISISPAAVERADRVIE
ncbi:MAG: hypothetical protein M3362_23105, partial [Acidobacteriota bacterium]|nr:hypothetical protein [Acidobacteriota bacterium]